MNFVNEVAATFLKQIHAVPLSDGLMQVSEGAYKRLIELAENTLLVEQHLQVNAAQELQALSDLAYEGMRSASSKALPVWRILYTDSCILQALLIVDDSTAGRSIGLLDRAIVFAGGGDENRMDLILAFINEIQQNLLPPQIPSRAVLNKCHCPTPPTPSTARLQVPTIDSNLSFTSFQNSLSSSPFVIKGFANDWPALNKNSWNSIDYLLSISGPARIVPVEVGNDYRDEDWNQVLMEWEQFLDAIREKPEKDVEALYLAQHNLMLQFPSLRRDILIPDYAYCALTPTDFAGYKPPTTVEGVILNMWLGPKAASSPAHFDPYYNLYAQIVGYKTVWLAPPETTPYMKGYSPMKRPDETKNDWPSENGLLNTSHLDVFVTGDIQSHRSDFSLNVVPKAMQVTLAPGDLLFFPPGWWHAMRSESTSFSVSMWF